MKVQDIFPELQQLEADDRLPAPLTYGPLIASLAKVLLASGEDPDTEGGQEGHRYFLLGAGSRAGENFGVLILDRYFGNDPCLETCEDIDEAQETCNRVKRQVFWSTNMNVAIQFIRRALRKEEAGHGAAGEAFLRAAEAITSQRIIEVLNLKHTAV